MATAPTLPAGKIAAEIGLRYVTDARPGIRRLRKGKGFAYIDAAGKPVRDAAVLERIRTLAIPPAWQEVWICPLSNGHIQATARDARGRKQYRYHARWRAVRDETKFDRLLAFGKALPDIRRRVAHDLALPGLPRDKVLAAVVRLMEQTSIRVGNEKYARDNQSYGATTLRDQHVKIRGENLRLRFRGKSGKYHDIELNDARLARVVRRCRDVPGQELFQYLDDEGQPRGIDSADVNAYLRSVSGADYTAKDFRTWTATVAAALALAELAQFSSDAEAKRFIVAAINAVAQRMGNTATICRKCYIHPAIIDAYLDGSLARAMAARSTQHKRPSSRLRAEETTVMKLLRRRSSRRA